MNPLAVNILSALAICLVISLMAILKESKARALVYSLPIPITIALIATGGTVSSSNVVGVLFVALFIWSVYYFYEQRKWPILLADVVMAIAYVVAAYIYTKSVALSFAVTAVAYLILWVVVMPVMKNSVIHAKPKRPNRLPLWVKSITVFVLAWLLFTLKGCLAGFVVTFPFSGVFAVFEGKDMLKILATIVTRNSIAVWAFFVTDYLLSPYISMWVGIAASWLVFGIVLLLVMKLVPLKNVGKQAPEMLSD